MDIDKDQTTFVFFIPSFNICFKERMRGEKYLPVQIYVCVGCKGKTGIKVYIYDFNALKNMSIRKKMIFFDEQFELKFQFRAIN